MKLERFDEAKEAIESAIKIKPEHSQAHFNLAMVCEQVKKDD
jgi:Flp pilus assembly protein TadD